MTIQLAHLALNRKIAQNRSLETFLNPQSLEGEVDFDTLYRELRVRHFDGIVTNNVFAWPDKVKWVESCDVAIHKARVAVVRR